MKKLFILFFIFVVWSCSLVFPQEVAYQGDSNFVDIINNEIRKLRDNIKDLQSQVDSMTGNFVMVYPDAGIALSNGTAWSTSISDNHASWDSAYTHSLSTSGNPHGVNANDVGLGNNSTPRFSRIGLGKDAHANAVMSAYGQYYSQEYTDNASSGNVSVDWNYGNVHYINLGSGTNNMTLNNPIGGGRYMMFIRQNANANATASWPTTVQWQNSGAPTITEIANKTDVVACAYTAVTGNYICGWSGNY